MPAPFQITINVRKDQEDSWRPMVLFNAALRKNPGPASLKDQLFRMQMAETLRRIVHKRYTEYLPDERPVFVMLTDRAGAKDAPATLILEGRLHLKDFEQGACQIKEYSPEPDNTSAVKKKTEKKEAPNLNFYAECAEHSGHAKRLFGVAGENVPRQVLHSKIIDGKKQYFIVRLKPKAERARREGNWAREEEIYLPAAAYIPYR